MQKWGPRPWSHWAQGGSRLEAPVAQAAMRWHWWHGAPCRPCCDRIPACTALSDPCNPCQVTVKRASVHCLPRRCPRTWTHWAPAVPVRGMHHVQGERRLPEGLPRPPALAALPAASAGASALALVRQQDSCQGRHPAAACSSVWALQPALLPAPPVPAPVLPQAAARLQAHSAVPLMSARAADGMQQPSLPARRRASCCPSRQPHAPALGAALRRCALPLTPPPPVQRAAGSGRPRCAAQHQHAPSGALGQALPVRPPLQRPPRPLARPHRPCSAAASPWGLPAWAACASPAALLAARPAGMSAHLLPRHLPHDAPS